MAVHCACTVRAPCVHCQNTHVCPGEAGNIYTGLCRSQEWQKKKIERDRERHMSPFVSMNWFCATEAVKNPENIAI